MLASLMLASSVPNTFHRMIILGALCLTGAYTDITKSLVVVLKFVYIKSTVNVPFAMV